MKIVWKHVDTDRCEGETRISSIARLKYEPAYFSEVLLRQLKNLETAGFRIRLANVAAWRTQVGNESNYSVFKELTIQRNALVLRTALYSNNCSSVEEATRTTVLGTGTLKSDKEPLLFTFDQREAIEDRALEIANQGDDVKQHWVQVEVAYESWHDRRLIAVSTLGESKMRTVIKQYDEEELKRLRQKYQHVGQANSEVAPVAMDKDSVCLQSSRAEGMVHNPRFA